MEYEVVIGLEVHTQLSTKSKIFCSCDASYGKSPNKNTCPICLGHPGVLPVLNREVVERAIKAGLATKSEIAPMSQFARKNYFYPDLPKGYQISQYDKPICEHGHINIVVDGKIKRIGLTRIHIEEDAGKLVHGENMDDPGSSYVDLNRTGVPLLEIVSEPDMRSSDEAKAYLGKLKTILEYIDISDCNMEEGSLRCDANISIRPKGEKELGTRTEIKNMNSFRFLQKALEFEIDRQIKIKDDGGKVIQETRLYDSNKNITISMRSKEEAHDYRYFPEPDLTPVMVDKEWIEKVRQNLPELPDAKEKRFQNQYELPLYDAEVLTASRDVAEYFEAAAKECDDFKAISNWVMGDVLRIIKEQNILAAQCPVKPESLAQMIGLIEAGVISGKIAKTVFEEMATSGKDPKMIVEEKGLTQISDSGAIEAEIDKIIESNPKQVEQYKGGKTKVIGFFVGNVMKATRGKANPEIVNKILKEKLDKA
ncbi:Aspartyl-tRNA(Asn) amidotransferase subunit B @ Glutamyl-tRNA(Gln) amidotransferase subunit B [hydrothermal vent metagenome]|uniref:Aspartyl-tRNA(Asn) amidotransferase subunit B @ Glutamyl-tRNA(Gln) amidotransferase subunit B n=1 Tax=hydrothermal vent metagenome TaxID=652676 RepID=A0A3B1BMZ7_9ZZZZ